KQETTFILFSEKNKTRLPFSEQEMNIAVMANETEAENYHIDGQNIVIFDLPQSPQLIEKLVSNKSPDRIYVHFYHDQDTYFSMLPTREHFKWYYAFLFKRREFDLKKN